MLLQKRHFLRHQRGVEGARKKQYPKKVQHLNPFDTSKDSEQSGQVFEIRIGKQTDTKIRVALGLMVLKLCVNWGRNSECRPTSNAR